MTKNSLSKMDPAEYKKEVEQRAFQYFCQKQLPGLEMRYLQNQFYSLKTKAEQIRNIEQRIKRLEAI